MIRNKDLFISLQAAKQKYNDDKSNGSTQICFEKWLFETIDEATLLYVITHYPSIPLDVERKNKAIAYLIDECYRK